MHFIPSSQSSSSATHVVSRYNITYSNATTRISIYMHLSKLFYSEFYLFERNATFSWVWDSASNSQALLSKWECVITLFHDGIRWMLEDWWNGGRRSSSLYNQTTLLKTGEKRKGEQAEGRGRGRTRLYENFRSAWSGNQASTDRASSTSITLHFSYSICFLLVLLGNPFQSSIRRANTHAEEGCREISRTAQTVSARQLSEL